MKKRLFLILAICCMTVSNVLADDFTVERAVNLGQLDSWADISKFQWQEIDHVIQDNREEMDALKTLFFMFLSPKSFSLLILVRPQL